MSTKKGNLISDGGEGYIYQSKDNPNQLLKIFKDTDPFGSPIVTDELCEKLMYMQKNPPDVLISKGIVAWPIKSLRKHDKLSGFVMPKLDYDEHIQRTYSYRHPTLEASEYERFPSVESRIKIAMNLCSAIDELHRKGYVFGDFNHHNIGVNYSTGQICFMDCDSYHITDDDGNIYRTNVIMPGYLAPEIIAHCNNERAKGNPYDLDTVALPTFTKESDLFCLAIHIFKLLMNGVDPFRGVKFEATGSTASPFIGNEAIERDAYVFKPGNKPTAVFCPPAETLPPDILELFNKAFIEGRNDPTVRPDAANWYITLNRFLTSELAQCSSNKKHQYYKYLSECPYCAADDRHMAEQVGNNSGAFNSAPVGGQMNNIRPYTSLKRSKILNYVLSVILVISAFIIIDFSVEMSQKDMTIERLVEMNNTLYSITENAASKITSLEESNEALDTIINDKEDIINTYIDTGIEKDRIITSLRNEANQASNLARARLNWINDILPELQFMRDFAAIQPNVRPRRYHHFGCDLRDANANFWIRNVDAASDRGYSPCPECWGKMPLPDVP